MPKWNHKVPDGCPLTGRQFELLGLLCEGLTYQQAALKLGISESTVRGHLQHICVRLDVLDAKGAVAALFRNGWWGWEPPPPVPKPPSPPRPLGQLPAVEPWLTVYLAEFDRWLGCGFRNQRARERMALAFGGACSAAGVRPDQREVPVAGLRRELQDIAGETGSPQLRMVA